MKKDQSVEQNYRDLKLYLQCVQFPDLFIFLEGDSGCTCTCANKENIQCNAFYLQLFPSHCLSPFPV